MKVLKMRFGVTVATLLATGAVVGLRPIGWDGLARATRKPALHNSALNIAHQPA